MALARCCWLGVFVCLLGACTAFMCPAAAPPPCPLPQTQALKQQQLRGERSSSQRTSCGSGFATGVRLAAKGDNEDLDETTKKYGLEVGLFKALKDGKKGSGGQAKELLKRYGSAYLVTSISFALVSFSICYLLVDNGIDISALLSKVGISATNTSEKVGTFAVAYAAHKAASPIRFPPTVALTPVVAKWIGREETPSED